MATVGPKNKNYAKLVASGSPLVANKTNTGMASTNPAKNVSNVVTQGTVTPLGVVNFDPNTGAKLGTGQSVAVAPETYGALPYNNQSLTVLSSDKTADKVKNDNALAEIGKKGVVTNPKSGVSTYADGSVYQPQEPTDGLQTANVKSEDKRIEDALEEMRKNTDEVASSQIANIQATYKALKEEQAKANETQLAATKTSLLQSGAAQHDVFAEDAVKYRTELGLKAIKDLEAEENAKIAEARAAQLRGRNDVLEKIVAQVNKVRDEKISAINKLNEDIIAANKVAREKNIQATRDNAIVNLYSQGVTDPATMLTYLNFDEDGRRVGDFTIKEVSESLDKVVPAGLNDLVKTLRTNGAPTEVIRKVMDSPDINTAYENAGVDNGVWITGSQSEYFTYARDAVKRGQVPVDPDTFWDIDANRKIRIAGAGSGGGGAGGTTYTTADLETMGVDTKDPFIKKLINSKGGKPITDTTIQKLDKGRTVLGQLGVLQANIEDVKTGPIVGAFRSANPWDTKAQTIKAQLNAIVPNLARGIYGEVGVLTDNDIQTYSKTIPNLKATEDVRNAILYITLDMIGKSIKNTLDTNASAGRDVSGFVDVYTEMQNDKNSVLSSIPGAKVPESIKGATGGGIMKTEEQAKQRVIEVSKANPKAAAAIASLLSEYSYMDIMEALPELFK